MISQELIDPIPREISAVADCMALMMISNHARKAALVAGNNKDADMHANKGILLENNFRLGLQIAQVATGAEVSAIISHAAWTMGLHPHMDPVDFRLAPIRHLTRRRVQKARLADQEPTNTRILLNLAQQTRQ